MLDAAHRLLEQLPEAELETTIPGRSRIYANLVYHVFSIPESFLEQEAGVPYTSLQVAPEWDHHSRDALSAYGRNVRRLLGWFSSTGESRDWSTPSDVFWGSRPCMSSSSGPRSTQPNMFDNCDGSSKENSVSTPTTGLIQRSGRGCLCQRRSGIPFEGRICSDVNLLVLGHREVGYGVGRYDYRSAQ